MESPESNWNHLLILGIISALFDVFRFILRAIFTIKYK